MHAFRRLEGEHTSYALPFIAALSGAYLIAYLFLWVFIAASDSFAKEIACSISVAIFIGVIAIVALLDWRSLITVRGLVNWGILHGVRRIALIGLLVIGFVVVLGAYLVQALLEAWRVRGFAQPVSAFVWPAAAQRLQGQASSAWVRCQKSFGGWKPPAKIAFGISVGCSGILATCLVCGAITVAVGAALPPAPTQSASSRILATATKPQQFAASGNAAATMAATPTATASPTPSPTPSPTAPPIAKPTASPTPSATPSPTATSAAKPTAAATPVPTKLPTPTNPPCANPCNPWGYNFNAGNRIYSPPGDFCDYFNCISNFWNGRGYVMECKDGRFSRSGGISGSCSRHGGNWRPLYSH